MCCSNTQSHTKIRPAARSNARAERDQHALERRNVWLARIDDHFTPSSKAQETATPEMSILDPRKPTLPAELQNDIRILAAAGRDVSCKEAARLTCANPRNDTPECWAQLVRLKFPNTVVRGNPRDQYRELCRSSRNVPEDRDLRFTTDDDSFIFNRVGAKIVRYIMKFGWHRRNNGAARYMAMEIKFTYTAVELTFEAAVHNYFRIDNPPNDVVIIDGTKITARYGDYVREYEMSKTPLLEGQNFAGVGDASAAQRAFEKIVLKFLKRKENAIKSVDGDALVDLLVDPDV